MIHLPLLSTLNLPADLARLSPLELTDLAAEIRALMIAVVGKNGGHLASGLGVVELTIALHRVFDFRQDALVLDVGHQCYTHKILTGRYDKFSSLRQFGGISGFPNAAESEYDWFTSGHASASIAQAAGVALAAKLRGEDRQAVVVIGDGALGGGLALEALNHLGHTDINLLVILNDNEMSIGKTVGAFAVGLNRIRSRADTTRLRERLRRFLRAVPGIGDSLIWLQERFLSLLKNHRGVAAIFESMNFRYFGPFAGHDLTGLIATLENLKKLRGLRLLHIVTEKGCGFSDAVADPETFHSPVPFTLLLDDKKNAIGDHAAIVKTGAKITISPTAPTYTDIFGATITELGAENPRLVAITAAMTAGTGLKFFAQKFPERFFDVGIAESYALTLAGGLARGGMLPVVAIYSTFLQRGYDQIFHDILLQKNLPVVLAIDRAGLVGNDGASHHGAFDISYLRHLPNLILLAPKDGDELAAMLRWAVASGKSCAIRYPRAPLPERDCFPPYRPLSLGKSEKLLDGGDNPSGALIAYGRLVDPVLSAAKKMANRGKEFAVYNARFAKPLDEQMLVDAAKTGAVWTFEDNALAGGFGGAVAEWYAAKEINCRLTRRGIPDEFIYGATLAQLDKELGLDIDGIVEQLIIKS